jgi:hypothetical protein
MKHLVNRSETAQDRIHCDTPLGSIMLHGRFPLFRFAKGQTSFLLIFLVSSSCLSSDSIDMKADFHATEHNPHHTKYLYGYCKMAVTHVLQLLQQ